MKLAMLCDFFSALCNADFIQKLTLLMITAILAGLLIPYLQDLKSRRQIIRDNQSKLYDEISITILTIQTLVLDVSWFMGGQKVTNLQKHQEAFAKYSDRFPDLLAQLRSQTIKAQHLPSPYVGQKLVNFQNELIDQDESVVILSLSANASRDDWVKCHGRNLQIIEQVKYLLSELAFDFKIVKSSHFSKLAL